jgi:hypothetical protein
MPTSRSRTTGKSSHEQLRSEHKERDVKRFRIVSCLLVLAFTGLGTAQNAHATGGTFTTVDDPKGTVGTQAYAINPQGDIVGTYYDGAGKAHGFLLSHG